MELSLVSQTPDEQLSPALSEIHAVPESSQIVTSMSRTYLSNFSHFSEQI